MKNITLAIDETVIEAVRVYAATRNTTVNALVRDHLTGIARLQDLAANARARLVELAEQSAWKPAKDWAWNRDEAHERGSVSRHEHSDLRSVPKTSRRAKTQDRD